MKSLVLDKALAISGVKLGAGSYTKADLAKKKVVMKDVAEHVGRGRAKWEHLLDEPEAKSKTKPVAKVNPDTV